MTYELHPYDMWASWRCECGDLNRMHEAFCYRCGAGQPEDAYAPEKPDAVD